MFIAIYCFNMFGTIVYAKSYTKTDEKGVTYTYDSVARTLEINYGGMTPLTYKLVGNKLEAENAEIGSMYVGLAGVQLSYNEKEIQDLTGYSAEQGSQTEDPGENGGNPDVHPLEENETVKPFRVDGTTYYVQLVKDNQRNVANTKCIRRRSANYSSNGTN